MSTIFSRKRLSRVLHATKTRGAERLLFASKLMWSTKYSQLSVAAFGDGICLFGAGAKKSVITFTLFFWWWLFRVWSGI